VAEGVYFTSPNNKRAIGINRTRYAEIKTMTICTTNSNIRTNGVAMIMPSPGNAKELEPFIHKPRKIIKRIKIRIETITEIASRAKRR
jgi:hypothetical protein